MPLLGWRPKEADLSLHHLASLQAVNEDDNKSSKYAENGVSAKRIREVLGGRQASGCNCRREWFAQSVFTFASNNKRKCGSSTVSHALRGEHIDPVTQCPGVGEP